jgi:CRISPR-associated protein Csd1
MIFHALHELYDRLEADPEYGVAPFGRSMQKITFKVVIRPDGTLHSIEDIRDLAGRSPRPVQVEVLGGAKPPGSALNPSFLWDNTQYMLGVKAEDSNPRRTQNAFEAFRKRHLTVEDEVQDAGLASVCRFLERWDPSTHRDDPVLNDAGLTGYGLFQIIGETRYVHDSPVIRKWWDDQPMDVDAVQGQCLVTGTVRPIARTHDKIKGVIGGQGAGGTIAGFNDPAYESYGLSQSFNAPVGETVAFRYVTALNTLLDGPRKERHRILLGDMTVAFWTDQPSTVESFFARFAAGGATAVLDDASAQDEGTRMRVEAILESIRRGRADPSALDIDPKATNYHILALSPNSARIAVHFYYRSSVAELLERLATHYNDLSLVRRPPKGKWAGDPEFPSFRELLDQTARERKDIPPLIAAPLLKAAVTGGAYPQAMYAAVLRRIAADRSVTYLRGCVLKGFLNRNLNLELSMALDLARTDPSYRLGRLFAALEKTQKDALEGLNKTIRDTYYGSASATPRSVFPRLLRTYQHHLAKMEGGFRVNRERLVQEIMEPLTDFPAHLDLADQGIFAIGYYHQTDAFYRKRDEGDSN